jgi:cell division protein DivIC|tara:strand:+ start:41493 stop:41822 length:330 start_codon:yes stop_codon:yes gene_type:complete
VSYFLEQALCFNFVEMKRFYPILKNKYVFTGILFLLYALFLDDMDIFSIVRQTKKLNQIEASREEVKLKLSETEASLEDLKTLSGKERYAREHKFFKKDDEDIFVITYN